MTLSTNIISWGQGSIRVNGSLDREQLLEEDEEVQVQVMVSERATAHFVP